MYDYSLFSTDFDFKSNGIRTLLEYPKDSFDLIIYDITIGLYLLSLVENFNNPPIVAVTPFLLPPSAATVFGSPLFTSYMPFYCTKYTDVMSLEERFYNFIFTYTDVFYFKYVFSPEEEKKVKKYFPNHKLTLKEIGRNIGILLPNTDPVLEYPIPLPPNVIPVGGLHAKPSRKLPQDIKEILDKAQHGAILFSLGTNLRSDKLDLTIRRAFLKAFSKLPQIVFWKFETNDIDDLPNNVYIQKWLPQNDILGHPNTVLLMNHGGGLSTQEAIYHGIPIVGIPHFADQHINVRRIVDKKIALYLDKDKLTFDNIYATLSTILNNPLYTANVKSLSKKFRNQPQTALERAVFWTEYVLLHGNVDHLSARSRDLPSIEIANIDVFLVLSLGLILMYYILSTIISQVYNLCKSRKKLKSN